MTTEIVDIPETLPLNPFPHVDDPEESYNAAAYEVGVQLPPAIERAREIVEAGRTNALAAKEQADRAVVEADRSRDEADAAEGFRNTAGEHATTATEQAGIATTQAGIATTQAGIATTQAGIAGGHAGDALTQANRAEDEADRAYDEANRAQAAADSISSGPVTSVNGKTGVVTLGATDIAPMATDEEMREGASTEPRSMAPSSVLASILANSRIRRVARTGNVQLTAVDSGKLIDITSGTFTQTFAAAATLGDGWFCYLKNSGTGDITLDPDASELIDGLTSYIMYPGEVRLVQCDGTALRTVVLNSFYKVFTASGTFIKPPGYVAFSGLLCGAGGSGGAGTDTQTFGGGGAGGARSPFQLLSSQVAASVLVVIGAGGSAVTGSIGNSGGQTSFGAIALNGGAGGNISASTAAGGATSFDATLTSLSRFNGGAGGQGATSSGAGANGIYGAGGGGGANNGSSTTSGGTSTFAGAGGLGGGTTPGSATSGSAPGGGGGGARYLASPYPSGAGGRGELSIWGII